VSDLATEAKIWRQRVSYLGSPIRGDRSAYCWNSRDGWKVIPFQRRRPWKYRND
jgi:hypothetical protein